MQDISIADNGQAEIEMKIDTDHAPLRVGTRATIREFSQSGIANRYIDLQMPNGAAKLPNGGRIGIDRPTTAVDLDELLTRSTRRREGTCRGSSKTRRGSSTTAGSRPTSGSST